MGDGAGIDPAPAGAQPDDPARLQGLTDVDPAPPSARRAIPPLAPPLDRGVQPLAAAVVVLGLVAMWWLRRQWLRRARAVEPVRGR